MYHKSLFDLYTFLDAYYLVAIGGTYLNKTQQIWKFVLYQNFKICFKQNGEVC